MTDATNNSDLKELIIKAKQIIRDFSDELGWQKPDHDVKTNLIKCPYDEAHDIPSER